MRWPGRRTKPSPPVAGNGMLIVGDAAFRRICAISQTGVYYFVPDRNDAELSAEVQRLQAAWDIPPCVERRAATLSGIAALNGAWADHAADGPPTPGALRMAEVIAEATRLRASDLKLIIRGTDAVLRMKLGSEEFTHGPAWQVREAEEALSWLFDERDKGDGASAEQSGQHQSFSVGHRQRIALPEGLVALRGQKAPHGDGHDFVVLRLITAGDATAAGRIEDLGLDEDVLEALARERHSDTGLVIIGGSTGDGKSTTLVRQLERLYQERKGRVSIMTVEDPIEYPIIGDGIVQMPVPGAAEGAARGAAFTRALRTFVRSNPDFGMVSEIRTGDDCRDIMQFVVSGHKVFTTVHSASAADVLFRLISLGVDSRELAQPGVVSLVMRQKLVPILCPDCARTATQAERAVISAWTGDDDGAPRIRNRDGCPTCLKGRDGATARKAWGGLARKRATAEVIVVDDAYRKCVEARDSFGARAHWLAPRAEGGLGGIEVTTRLKRLVAAGEADYEDITSWPANPAGTGSSAGIASAAGGAP